MSTPDRFPGDPDAPLEWLEPDDEPAPVDVRAAAEHLLEFIGLWGDGTVDTVNDRTSTYSIHTRDLEAVCRAALGHQAPEVEWGIQDPTGFVVQRRSESEARADATRSAQGGGGPYWALVCRPTGPWVEVPR